MSLLDKIGGNGAKVYRCTLCGAPITTSDRLIVVEGSHRHMFVNPAGVPCDFDTFYACPGAVALGQATDAHSWFVGYAWRMAFCRLCGRHLGWSYQSLAKGGGFPDFWGMLVEHLHAEIPQPL